MRHLVLVLAVAATAVGCATASTSGRVADSLSDASEGCRVERQSKLVMGRATLGLVRWLSEIADGETDDEAREILRGVRRVEVTTYRVTPQCSRCAGFPTLGEGLATDGWYPVVIEAESSDGQSWVLAHDGGGGTTDGILVVTLDQGELEVVRIDGDIERVLVAALADDPAAITRLARGDS